jgi:hypothetical protein
MCGTFPARPFLVLITLVLFAKEYRLRNCSFLSPPASGYLPSLSSKYYPQQTSLKTSYMFFCRCERASFTPMQITAGTVVLYNPISVLNIIDSGRNDKKF